MAKIGVNALAKDEIRHIHDASVAILRDTGIMVHHDDVLRRLGNAGAKIDKTNKIARIGEKLITESLETAGKQYILYGRDGTKTARFGYGDFVLMSSPGQYRWLDANSTKRRPAAIQDARDAIQLGDALDNLTIVGSMASPQEIPESYREVVLTAELVKGTTKPTRTWIYNRRTAKYILEIYSTIAGGADALADRPMIETFMEPISPLQLPKDGLDIVIEFVKAGQPVSIGPMAQSCATAPGTLAGTLAQENAEILAGIVVTQILRPGTCITYGGIPHIMDPRTGICSFGSPEQSLMAVAMVQMAQLYGLPVYVNVNLTDSKLPDAQAGIEKASSMLLAALAGADTFGHAGICGTDHAASLEWLRLDCEIADYVKRILRGFEINPGTLATGLINSVGPKGNFRAEQHTAEHFRKELWLPNSTWTRDTFDAWQNTGEKSMADRIQSEVNHILTTHQPEPIDEALAKELDRIVASAKRELAVGKEIPK